MIRTMCRSALVLSLTLLAFPLLAQRPTPHPPSPAMHGPLGRCLAVVELTEAQKMAVRAALESTAPGLRAAHEQLQTDRKTLETALQAANPEGCAVGTALLKVRSDEQKIRTETAALQTRIEAVLTPDQKLKFEGCMQGLSGPHDAPRR